jgi:hypothetical protein
MARKTTKVKSEDIKANSTNSTTEQEKTQQQADCANKQEQEYATPEPEPLTDNDIRIIQGEVVEEETEEEVEEDKNVPIKIKQSNGTGLDDKEIAFVKRLFNRYNQSSFWEKFWSAIAVLLVLGMCWLIYMFLKSAGTIPFTHMRFV